MADFICREELIKALEADYNRAWSSKPQGVEEYVEGARDEYDDVLKIVCGMQAADVQPVKRGRWLPAKGWFMSKCSECGYELGMCLAAGYICCPKCTARMDGDTE